MTVSPLKHGNSLLLLLICFTNLVYCIYKTDKLSKNLCLFDIFSVAESRGIDGVVGSAIMLGNLQC